MRISSLRRGLFVAALAVVAVAGGLGAAKFVSSATGGESMIAGSSIRFVGPFYSTQQSFDSTNGGQVGGEVRIWLATDTLRIGDIVVETASNAVTKSATTGNHEKVVGVVVGGRSTDMVCSLLSADVGTIAALPNRPVVVLRRGRTYVRMDTTTATDTLHPGQRFKPSTLNAGKAVPVSTFSVAADGMTKITGTGIKLVVPGGLALVDVNAK